MAFVLDTDVAIHSSARWRVDLEGGVCRVPAYAQTRRARLDAFDDAAAE